MGKNLNFFGSAIIVLAVSGQAQAPLYPLPKDEKEAYIMIEEGALDSALWLLVRQYYEQPILVPQGELKNLVDVFPNSIPSVPYTESQLAPYEPWKASDIERFFSDFPELVNFSPILCFETDRERYHARIRTAFQKFGESAPVVVSSVKSAPAAIQFDGSARFEADFARLQRRTLEFRTTRAGRVTLGNFNLNLDRGLFYGYFPDAPSDTDAASNWRFAETNSWNGALYESPIVGHSSALFFFHERKNESAYGTRLSVAKIGSFRFFAGVSHLAVPEFEARTDGFTYANAEANFSDDHWNAGLIGGGERGNRGAIPFIAYAKHGAKDPGPAGNRSFEILYARMPAGCAALRSALLRECIEKTDKDDSAAVDRSLVKTLFRTPLNSRMKSDFGAAYYSSPGHPAAEGFAAVSGRAWLNYSLRYTFRPVLDNSPQYHCITISMNRALMRAVSGRAYCRYINKEAYQSYYARLSADVTALPSMEVSPFAVLYAKSGRGREFSIGLTQTLSLFEKTWAELKVEVPVVKTMQDQWTIDAKALFYL